MEKLYVAIDPGFDSIKVIANGNAFKFPFNVITTDERKINDYYVRDDFMLYKAPTGTTYRIGSYAREMEFESKSDEGDFYTESRFLSDEFKAGMDTALALAFEKSGLADKMEDVEVYLIVALPHAQRAKYADNIVGKVAGEHKFSLRCGKQEEKAYHFAIKKENVRTVSQTIAAILGETSDENGNIDEAKSKYLTDGPTLVLDGGYYTFGMACVSKGGTVDDSKAASDTNYAMKNVNVRICNAVRDQRPDLQHYMIEYLLNKDNGIIKYVGKDGKAGTLDLKTIRSKKVNEVCDEFIKYLNEKYNNLVDFGYILLTGGTGATYYPRMLKYYKDKGLFDEKNFLLSGTKLYDKEFSIEYAIAVGAYKGLQGTFGSNK